MGDGGRGSEAARWRDDDSFPLEHDVGGKKQVEETLSVCLVVECNRVHQGSAHLASRQSLGTATAANLPDPAQRRTSLALEGAFISGRSLSLFSSSRCIDSYQLRVAIFFRSRAPSDSCAKWWTETRKKNRRFARPRGKQQRALGSVAARERTPSPSSFGLVKFGLLELNGHHIRSTPLQDCISEGATVMGSRVITLAARG